MNLMIRIIINNARELNSNIGKVNYENEANTSRFL